MKYLRHCCPIASGKEKILLTSLSPWKNLFFLLQKGVLLFGHLPAPLIAVQKTVEEVSLILPLKLCFFSLPHLFISNF